MPSNPLSPNPLPPISLAPVPPRIPAVDVARGVAIVAMVIYHFTWDLGFFGFTHIRAGVDPGWRLFAKLIAGSFLLLVGVGLVLAHRAGVKRGAFLRRLGFIAGGAALVSVATYMQDPGSFVFFGILHSIAVSSVLALPFLRAPVWLTAAVAAFVLAAPLWLVTPALDGPAWWWLGLSATLPRTNDYEPLAPWFGVVLAGVVLARLALAAGLDAKLARWSAADPLSRALRWLGRWSLPIYLVHQPVLFGLLSLTVALGAPRIAAQPPAEFGEAGFVRACVRTCAEAGVDRAFCTVTCGCVVEELRGTGLVARSQSGAMTPADEQRIRDAALACRGQEMDTAPDEPETPAAPAR